MFVASSMFNTKSKFIAMKKSILVLGISVVTIGTAFGQWIDQGATIYTNDRIQQSTKIYLTYSNGNNYIRAASSAHNTYFDGGGGVGIGHQSQYSGYRLHVHGNTNLNGSVGIGIGNITPSGKLTIKGSALSSSFADGTNEHTYIRPGNGTTGNVIMDYGNVGIGTASPQDKLDVDGNLTVGSSTTSGYGNGGEIQLRRHWDGQPTVSIKVKTVNGSVDYDEVSFYSAGGGSCYTFNNANPNNGGELMRIGYYGEVGIGTNAITGYKLSVGGPMRAAQIEVTNPSTWSDFVFDDDYRLSSLEEVEAFIEENNHLPDVPSENEIMNEGFDLAEMDAVLLRKIEELTLYVIELKKENEELRGMISNK